jgi:uncharacterized protein YkwD
MRFHPGPAFGKKAVLIVSVFLLSLLTSAVPLAESQETRKIPMVDTIEEALVVLLNAEREKYDLPPVSVSPELVRLARRHSKDMAGLGILTHSSDRGTTLSDRLDRAKVLFRANGENVALSETYVPELIHASFMKSPEHRDNILKADFNEVGIGVFLASDGEYFVTVDFIQSIAPRGEDAVREYLLGRANDVREENGLPLLALLEEANDLANTYSRSRAAGRKLKAVPPGLGSSRILFMDGPDLAEIGHVFEDGVPASCSQAGIGVWFGRTAEYPGGAYYVCAVCLLGGGFEGLGPAERVKVVLGAANELRLRKKLEPLVLDSRLSKSAEGFAGRRRPAGVPLGAYAGIYETQDLNSVPAAVRKKIEDDYYGRIGLAVLLGDKGIRKSYLVAFILNE